MSATKNKAYGRIALIAAAAVLVAACLSIYSWRKHVAVKRAAAQNPIVAVVNTDVLHASDLKTLSPPVTRDEALGLMVDFTLVDQAARKHNISVSNAELDEQRQVTIANENVKTYAEAAQMMGRTPAGLDLQLRHVVLLQKLADQKLPRDPKQMYHALGILIKPHGKHAGSEAAAQAYAESLQKRISGGADMAALARTESEDTLSGPNGGDLGIIQNDGAPNRVKAADDFGLQLALSHAVTTAHTGSFLNGPVHGSLGYWVVRVVSTSQNPLGDAPRYYGIVMLWRSVWTNKLEPGIMGRLRSAAWIQPPIANPEPQSNSRAPSGKA